jgi:predicted helicase
VPLFMPRSTLLKPSHKAIQRYYQALHTYSEQHVHHEGATETAFQQLLAEPGRVHDLTLIPKLRMRGARGTNIFPDGTLRDSFNLLHGFWEAKDTRVDLDVEISKKIDKGYPLNNTIFEDTRTAVLYQNGHERYRLDITDAKQLASLLDEFYAYTEPEIDNFEQAVEEFKERVPELAKGLVEKIADAHKTNKKFQSAFDSFFALCRQTLNPNISAAAVDEMLVQHLLTERLIRKIFDNPEFTPRNVIAVEVEKVIDALVSLAFNRNSFLRSLDRFYRAIEDAAHGLDDFTEKQHFLNTVYERFFQGYSVKVADTHGIVCTPQAIVDFICASVAEVLQTEFGLSLGSPCVNILDPCTGTGNFIVNLLRRIPKKDLPRKYREQLFANEVMLLPYYIAALNIEHAYFELTAQYEAFEGLCFVDSLELAEREQPQLAFMTDTNTARVERQKRTPITVIIGNPPYNVGQLNENDNNKNRKYDAFDQRVRETYAKDSTATSVSKLNDAYVKFFRWAVDRLEGRDGVVCFVSNNSLVDNIAFDGMRKHLYQDFTRIYHLHLEGNVRHNPKLAGTTYNVFGIQVGVGITLAVKAKTHSDHLLYFYRIEKNLRKEEKLEWLSKHRSLGGIELHLLIPDSSQTWLVPEHAQEFAQFLEVGSKEGKAASSSNVQSIFKIYSLGVVTARDDVVYDYQREPLVQRVLQFIEDYNSEVDRYKRSGRHA